MHTPNNSTRRSGFVAAALSMALAGGIVGSVAAPAARGQSARAALGGSAASLTAEGITRPSDDADLAAEIQALVAEVPVSEGQQVKAGEVLLQQDTRVAQKELDIYRMEAESEIRVDAAVASRDTKEQEFKRVEKMFNDGVSNSTEFERAQLEFVLSERQLDQAKFEREKARLEAERQAIRLEQMQVLSPFDGIVESVEVSKGEVVDPERPVIRVVRIDPLKIEAFVWPEQTHGLKVGDQVEVRYEDEQEWRKATVDFLSPVVNDIAMREVGLSMPNPDDRVAGLKVLIRLPETAVSADVAGAAGSPAAADASATR